LRSNTSISIMSTSTAAETKTTIKALLKPTGRHIESVDAQRLDQLRRIYSNLIATKQLVLQEKKHIKPRSDATQKWNEWLKKSFSTFVDQLCHVVKMGRKSGVRTFIGVIASTPKDDGTLERIDDVLVRKLVGSLMDSYGTDGDGVVPEGLLDLTQAEFFGRYNDSQYFVLVAMKNAASQLLESNNEDEASNGIKAENLVRILMKIEIASDQDEIMPKDVKMHGQTETCSNYLFLPPTNTAELKDADYDGDDDDDNLNDGDESSGEDSDEEVPQQSQLTKQKLQVTKPKSKPKLLSWQSIRQHRNALQSATLTILKIPTIPPRTLKRILQDLPIKILPHVANPLRFADFCTRAYDIGGVTSLLSLHSLFVLMTQCGLEYPKFYPSLYNLIESKIFYAKYRSRFFKLLVKCLTGNQMLPAYIVAAFCKRLCRCAVNAPPSGALFVLALVSNLLRKHPECACLVHRKGGKIDDPYDPDNEEPAKSRAIDSCLWELNALEKHYHPAVASMAKGCGMEDSNTLYHDLDGFLVHTYKSLFDQERKRGDNKRKSKVPVTFQKPESLFVDGDSFKGIFEFSQKKIKL